jgi:excisionase family DNA binding protein
LLAVADRPQTAVQLSERLALSIPEAAASLGVSERHLRSVLTEIPRCHVGNRVLIPVAELTEWLRKKASEEVSAVGKAVEEILEEIQSH